MVAGPLTISSTAVNGTRLVHGAPWRVMQVLGVDTVLHLLEDRRHG
jgi:hypothetical protein